jgi:hypothetical protein
VKATQINFDFERGWLPRAQLQAAHYATGRTPWAGEVGIYCIGHLQFVNVATGGRVTVTGWKKR